LSDEEYKEFKVKEKPGHDFPKYSGTARMKELKESKEESEKLQYLHVNYYFDDDNSRLWNQIRQTQTLQTNKKLYKQPAYRFMKFLEYLLIKLPESHIVFNVKKGTAY